MTKYEIAEKLVKILVSSDNRFDARREVVEYLKSIKYNNGEGPEINIYTKKEILDIVKELLVQKLRKGGQFINEKHNNVYFLEVLAGIDNDIKIGK
jgi:hypothetical protein